MRSRLASLVVPWRRAVAAVRRPSSCTS